jgi:hypothetical protein
VDDDGSGWHEVLLAVWDDTVRDAVVDRLERTCTGRLGWFARVFATPDTASEAVTETVHALVLAAIRDETGADLDELGSQAAWDCYEAVWSTLDERWHDGGTLWAVALGAEPQVVRDLAALPPEAAAAAGADVSAVPPRPLWIRGRLRIDAEGLRHYLKIDGGVLPREVHHTVMRILGTVERPGVA